MMGGVLLLPVLLRIGLAVVVVVFVVVAVTGGGVVKDDTDGTNRNDRNRPCVNDGGI